MHVLASARPRGRPWSALRAWRGDRELTLGQSRHGGQDAGLGEGWDKKRAHHGGRALADEVCTRVTWPFCQGLPRRAAGPPLCGETQRPAFHTETAVRRPKKELRRVPFGITLSVENPDDAVTHATLRTMHTLLRLSPCETSHPRDRPSSIRCMRWLAPSLPCRRHRHAADTAMPQTPPPVHTAPITHCSRRRRGYLIPSSKT